MELRERIERVYRAVTGERDPRGALAWFARRAHVHAQTVSRWVNNHTEIQGPALALLEHMEKDLPSDA